MEANFCRRLFAELAEKLGSPRIDKIYNPAPDVWTFSLSTTGGGLFLLYRRDRKTPLLFTSEAKPDNPREPSARCMWFRKRLQGARLIEPAMDWPNRTMAWKVVTGNPEAEGKFLVFDLSGGLELEDGPPPGAGNEPAWPPLEAVLGDRDVWRAHPQITPPLRRVLKAAPRTEAEQIYGGIKRGERRKYYCYTGKGAGVVLPWRLAGQMAEGLEERAFDSALEAAAAFGSERLFTDLTRLAEAPQVQALKNRERRLLRNLENVARDEERLKEMVLDARRGEIVKSVLYEHGPDERLEEIEGFAPDGSREVVRLNPAVSVSDNMERFFKRAAKGKRGLGRVSSRRRELEKELAALRAGKPPAGMDKISRGAPGTTKKSGAGYKGMAVAAYVTDDGFTVLRGKNQQANHELLSRAASRRDLWFHARGVPGSHVILKRDHPGQTPPERSLVQAASIAALHSAYGPSAPAEVVCALVGDVRKIKGAAKGLVAVDEEYASFRVTPDPDLVERLKR